MQIKGKKIMVLGGYGLVGKAVCDQILDKNPSELVITSLFENEAKEACDEFKNRGAKLHPVWGNLFVRESFKDLTRSELMDNPDNRARIPEGNNRDNEKDQKR